MGNCNRNEFRWELNFNRLFVRQIYEIASIQQLISASAFALCSTHRLLDVFRLISCRNLLTVDRHLPFNFSFFFFFNFLHILPSPSRMMVAAICVNKIRWLESLKTKLGRTHRTPQYSQKQNERKNNLTESIARKPQKQLAIKCREWEGKIGTPNANTW